MHFKSKSLFAGSHSTRTHLGKETSDVANHEMSRTGSSSNIDIESFINKPTSRASVETYIQTSSANYPGVKDTKSSSSARGKRADDRAESLSKLASSPDDKLCSDRIYSKTDKERNQGEIELDNASSSNGRPMLSLCISFLFYPLSYARSIFRLCITSKSIRSSQGVSRYYSQPNHHACFDCKHKFSLHNFVHDYTRTFWLVKFFISIVLIP